MEGKLTEPSACLGTVPVSASYKPSPKTFAISTTVSALSKDLFSFDETFLLHDSYKK
jgi:hypothetical protein